MPNWTAVKLAKDTVLFVEAEGDALRRAQFGTSAGNPPEGWAAADRKDKLPVLRQAAQELKEYMAGQRRVFSVTFEVDGTEFQCRVWQALCEIPFGEVRSYADIAKALEKPKATRAVGSANGRNPLPVFIPCHRVIGSDGSLAGYSAGVEVKRVLLACEGILL
ncbi:MAG TPA: methylated-DNA--[protein]-cysteine S-methyltransferase [Paludibaculum sp.]|jgi:methylated-DNA-[protein]-cysteine S-methyltransferase